MTQSQCMACVVGIGQHACAKSWANVTLQQVDDMIHGRDTLRRERDDARTEAARLREALKEAREVFNRQVEAGALYHSTWDQMAGIAMANIDRALAGRERTPQVWELPNS